jgi:hypothetical protein
MPGPPAALACHQPSVMARLHCDSTPYRRSLDVPLAAGPCRDDLHRRRLEALAVVAVVPASTALLPAGGGVSPCGSGGSTWRWRWPRQMSSTAKDGVPSGGSLDGLGRCHM